MRSFVLRRVIALPLLLLSVYTLTFFLARLAPGGPWDVSAPVAPAVRENLRRIYHADEPLVVQYWLLLENALKGDLGPSYGAQNKQVLELISDALPVSLKLGLAATGVSLLLGLCVGIPSAYKPNSKLDQLTRMVGLTWLSIPPFVLGPLLILVFAIYLGVLPTGGWNGLLSSRALMPIIVLSLAPAATIARFTRGSIMDVLSEDYIRTARAKALSKKVYVFRHVLRNALLPLVTIASEFVGRVVTGVFFVEVVFNIPGLGLLLFRSLSARDYPVILGVTLSVALIVIFSNLAADVLYAVADPRIRLK